MDQPERHLTGMGLSVVVYAVEGLDVGTWDLDPLARELVQVRSGLFRSAMSELMCGMAAPLTASFTVVITCDIHARQQAFPYERALRELYVQTGQVGQWIVIAAETAGLGCLTTPATNDVLLSELLDLPPDRIPLYTVTAGRKIGRNPGPGAVTL
jgi:nitroreductase